MIGGSFNAYGSEGPVTFTVVAGEEALSAGILVCSRLLSGEPPRQDAHGLRGDNVMRKKITVEVLTLAFIRIATRSLRVPEDCFSFIWGRRHYDADLRCQRICVTMNLHPLSDEFYDERYNVNGSSYECLLCYSSM